MRLHQLAGKWQAETKRLPLFRLLGSLEPIECKRLRLDVHAWPVVRYNDTCRSGRAISVDKHAAALGRIAQCIGQQVIEGFAQAATIPRNFAQRRLDPDDQIDSLGLCLLPEFSRSEEHTSELQSLMRNSYADFCLKKKKQNNKIKNVHKDTPA